MDFVDQVKSAIDIVGVVGDYVRLRKNGASAKYLGLCPFHTEKTPSFNVDSAKQFYYCFGCQKGGDAFKFVMEIEGVTFFEALKSLSERYGIPMPKRAEYSDADTKLKSSLYEMHELAARIFQNNLTSSAGAEARAYLKKRGVTQEIAEEFGLGLSDRSGQTLARRFEQQGFAPEAMEASGLVLKRNDGTGHFDRFRGRLMFPIHSESGKIIAFGGRALAADDEPKYLNSPETTLYSKRQVLYNLHRAKEGIRKHDRSILVEGYMDVIGVYASGIKEVVASCGTALKDQQVQALRRHSEKIVVNFDPDAAGENATERSVQMLLEEGMHVRILQLRGGLDPDEFIKVNGAEHYRALAEKAGGYFHWLADRIRTRYGSDDAEQRTAGFKALLPAIQRIPDKLERAAVANEMAHYLQVEHGISTRTVSQAAGRPCRSHTEAHRKTLDTGAGTDSVEIVAEQYRGARVKLSRNLRGHGAVAQFSTRRIFDTLCGIEEPITYSALEARLEDKDKSPTGLDRNCR